MTKYKDTAILKESIERVKKDGSVEFIPKGTLLIVFNKKRKNSMYLVMIGNKFGDNIQFLNVYNKDVILNNSQDNLEKVIPNLISEGWPESLLQKIA